MSYPEDMLTYYMNVHKAAAALRYLRLKLPIDVLEMHTLGVFNETPTYILEYMYMHEREVINLCGCPRPSVVILF